jgi:predicted ATPase
VRIAFSGTHRVGKSTLLDSVAEALPGYTTVEEPYYLLEEEGYESADPPSQEDFEAQLERSLEALEEGGRNVLYDRCPADVLAYLLTLDPELDVAPAMEQVRAAMRTLDFVVFVPIEDRVALPAHEDETYRRTIEERLRELLDEFEADVLSVRGDERERLAQVLGRIGAPAR